MGHGSLLAAIFQTHPTMRGVLFDRPEVTPGAKLELAAAVSANAVAPDLARELIRFVTGPHAVPIIRSRGMEPW